MMFRILGFVSRFRHLSSDLVAATLRACLGSSQTGSVPAGFMRGAAVLIGGRAGFHILGLLTGVLLARGLGPEGRGSYLAVLLWPTILGWLATLGMTKATTYLRSRHPHHERDLITIGLWVALISGGGFALAGQLLLPWLLPGYPEGVVRLGRLVLLLVPIVTLSDILMGVFDGARQFRVLTLFRLGLPMFQTVGLTVLYLAGCLTVWTAVWLYLVGAVLTVGLQYLTLAARSGVALRPPKTLVREAGRYGGRFYPTLVAEVALSSLDQALLIPLVSPGDMGLYVIATRAAILIDVPVAIAQVVFAYVPRMSPAQGLGLAQRAALAGVVVTGVLGAVLLFAARQLIWFLYGDAFAGAVGLFQILLAGAFAAGVRKILADGLSGLGKPQHSSTGQLIALVAMALLLWMMVPRFGVTGAAWAVTAAQWLNLAVTGMLFWVERRRALSPDSLPRPTE